MKNSEIIQRIQSLYSKGVQSDDSRLSPMHIFNVLISLRNELLAQKRKKKQIINKWNYQVLECIEMVETTMVECGCIPIKGCKIYKSKFRIPKPISDYNSEIIEYVTSLNGQLNLNSTNFEQLKYRKGRKYTKDAPFYFIKNNHLYSNKGVPLTMSAIFEDPIEALKFRNMCNNKRNNCNDILEKEFPLDSDMIRTLIQLAVQELIQQFNSNIEDQTNNTEDNEQSK